MATLSRTPSPAASGSDSDSVVATPLTPRSKLKALFATLGGGSSSEDDDADTSKENASPSRAAAKAKKAKRDKKTSPSRPSPRSATSTKPTTPIIERATSLSSSSSSNGGSDEEDNDVAARPRGRFAARMLAESNDQQQQQSPTAAPVETAAIPSGATARERVKRMLLAQQDKQNGQQSEPSEAPEDHDNDAEDEDDDVPVVARPRKLLNRAARRSASPRQAASPSSVLVTPSKRADREDTPDMFVTPSKEGPAGADVALSPAKGRTARFQALVAKKRDEARAREAEEERKRAARLAAANEEDDVIMRDNDDDDDDVSDITDDEGGRKLTQDVRPAARKASKKALEEMHRETQRMSRNLQLAHEAKTKKKITKASLFERFNFKPEGETAATADAPADAPANALAGAPANSSRPTSPVSHAETEADKETPPSSPPVLGKSSPAKEETAVVDKGKGKAVAVAVEEAKPLPKRQVRVRLPVQANLVTLDSDDELEIVQTAKSKLDALFDNVPLKQEQEPRSMLALRRLAQIGSPGKQQQARRAKDAHSRDLTLGELQLQLQERARQQAKLEREQRLEMLRSKGIAVQTEEEREKEMAEVEDIVERARREAEEIMQREKEDAKKDNDGNDDGETKLDPLAWDDSDEEAEDGGDYVPEEEREIELSGSEEEEEDNDDDEDKESVEGALIDGEAESGDESDKAASDHDDEVQPTPTRRARPTKRRAAVVISDDEDEGEGQTLPVLALLEAKTPGPKKAMAKSPSGLGGHSDSPQVPTSVLRSATKNFIPGLPVALGSPAGMGLTQIFAGTMADDSQLGGSPGFGSPTQMMPTLGNFADIPASQDAAAAGSGHALILSSQPTQEWVKQVQAARGGGAGGEAGESGSHGNDNDTPSQAVQLDFSQSQMHGLDSLLRDPDVSQLSGFMDSQDAGPQENTPLKVRFIEHQRTTVEAVSLTSTASQPQSPSQLPTRKRGKLFRKTEMVDIAEEAAEEEEEEEEEAVAVETTAFSMMREAVHEKKKQAAYDRKKSKAKEMVEEQAEESEDEYAGLGGADGEDSDNESLASVKDIIDDDQKMSTADNAKLAAFYADRERETDEKQVQKLFRDVTTGMLRRKRGADYDLSDSDDGGEARRRMKRRQFARMQKALFTDERISKVAENPRNQAFMRTIEDRGSDDEMDFIFDRPATGPSTGPSTGSSTPTVADGSAAAAPVAVPDSQPVVVATERREGRRRSATGKKPSSLGDIRQSLSNLLEEDDGAVSVVADTEFGSDEENEDPSSSNKESHPRRPGHRGKVPVVDRIHLKRGDSSSSNVSSANGGSSRAAFDTGLGGGSMGPTGFKVPGLLRRATTNSLMSTSTTSTSSGGRSGGSGANGASSAGGNHFEHKIKKNASKQSGVNYFARENERRAAVAESEKRRQAKKVRSAEGRSRVVGGLFGGGHFE